MKRMSGEELNNILRRAKNCEQDAIDTLVYRYIEYVNEVVSMYSIKDEDKNDLIHDGVLIILNSIEEYNFDLVIGFNNYVKGRIKDSLEKSVKMLDYERNNNVNSSLNNVVDNTYDGNLIQFDTDIYSYNYMNELEEIPFIDTILDSYSMEDSIVKKELQREVRKFLQVSDLNETEKKIIGMRYGLNGERYTFAEIGTMINVSHQRAKEIYETAINRLRRKKSLKDLAIFLDYPSKADKLLNSYQPGINKNKKKVWYINVELKSFYDFFDLKEESINLFKEICFYLPRREKRFLSSIFGTYYLNEVNIRTIRKNDIDHIEVLRDYINEIIEMIETNDNIIGKDELDKVIRNLISNYFSKRVVDGCENLEYYFDYFFTTKQLKDVIEQLPLKYRNIINKVCYDNREVITDIFNYSETQQLEDALFYLKTFLIKNYPNSYASSLNEIFVRCMNMNNKNNNIKVIGMLNKDMYIDTYGKPLSFYEVLVICGVLKNGDVTVGMSELGQMLGLTEDEIYMEFEKASMKLNNYKLKFGNSSSVSKLKKTL